CEEGAFTPEEMEIYDQYWDRISTEKGLNWQFRKDGLAEGLAKGEAKGRAKELERIVLSAYQNKLSIEQIQAFSGLSKDAIHKILNR
ncbi:MAG: hypothetical protein LBF08_00200, partial [Dysgonamonadaceae bacterium]|nr:hypothetical protein [Dysgonamonadaceae bacterium]